MIYYGGVYHPLVDTLSEEQAFTSPASDHSTEQAKKTEDSEFLMNTQKERHSKIPDTAHVRNMLGTRRSICLMNLEGFAEAGDRNYILFAISRRIFC